MQLITFLAANPHFGSLLLNQHPLCEEILYDAHLRCEEKNNTLKVTISFLCVLFFGVFGLIFFSTENVAGQILFVLCEMILIIIMFVFMMQSPLGRYQNRDIHFIYHAQNAIEELQEKESSRLGIDEVKRIAKLKLVERVVVTLEQQQLNNEQAEKDARAKLNQVFDLFKEFGLVRGDFSSLFAEAEKSIKEKVLTPQ